MFIFRILKVGKWMGGEGHLICFYSAPVHPIFHPPFSAKEMESLFANLCRLSGQRRQFFSSSNRISLPAAQKPGWQGGIAIWKVFARSESFRATLETTLESFWMVWKFAVWSGKLEDGLERFRSIKNLEKWPSYPLWGWCIRLEWLCHHKMVEML